MEDASTQQVVEHLLTLGDTMLCVDSRHTEVRVPEAHRGRGDLRLVISLGFRHPIHVLPEGIQADLLFGGMLHHCWIPYQALWGAYHPGSGEGTLWPDRMPVELLGVLDAGGPPETGEDPAGRTPSNGERVRPVLAARSGTRQPVRPVAAPAGARAAGRPSSGRKPALRVLPGGKGKPPAP